MGKIRDTYNADLSSYAHPVSMICSHSFISLSISLSIHQSTIQQSSHSTNTHQTLACKTSHWVSSKTSSACNEDQYRLLIMEPSDTSLVPFNLHAHFIDEDTEAQRG